MSRIGKKPISIPSGVTVNPGQHQVEITGPKGSLFAPLFPEVTVAIDDGHVRVSRKNDSAQAKAYHGLVRSVIHNHIVGVSEGYQITLKLVGTGYRAQAKGQGLSMAVGFSHPVEVMPSEGITFKVEGNDTIIVSGVDKHLVGQVAANIRKIKPPEPYQGKGVRYADEVVRRKQGKTAA